MDKRVKLIDFAPLQRGFDLPNSELRTGEYPVVYSNGVRNFHAEYMIKGPGVVTGRSGTIGNVHYVDGNYWPHNTSLWVTDFKGNHPKYVYYVYKAINYGKYNSGSGVPTLNRNDIHHEFVFCPPLPEQKAIANILQSWDTAIEKTEALIVAKEKQFSWLVTRLISNQFENPNWAKMTLGDSGYCYIGLSGKNRQDFGSGKPYLPYLNVFNNPSINPKYLDYVSIRQGERQHTVKKGDVFFTVSSETPEDVGTSSVLLDDIGECYLNSFCFGWRCTSKEIVPEFLQYYFRSFQFRHQAVKLAQGVTRFNLSKSQLMKAHISYPDATEQKRIAHTLNTARQEIDTLKTLADRYRTQKRGLMQKLLTGKWRVKL